MEIIGVSESALKYIRVHIITGALAPGQKLNEIELAKFLGISRAPLREAFRILENEHLVVSIPRKGCCVTGLSMKDCQEIFGVRTMMECFAVDLIGSHGIRELPNVEEALEKTAELKNPENTDAYAKFNYLRSIADFHITLVEAAGNRKINQLYNAIFSGLARYQSLYTYIPGLMEKSQKEHEHFLKLIKKGKYATAKESLSLHINKFIPLIEEKVRSLEKIEKNGICETVMF
jgi:DNA-binding GntR family transcriptional regulator